MKCPICEAPLRPGTERCPSCGYRIVQSRTAPQEPPFHTRSTYTPPNRGRKGVGCCCSLAVVIAIVVFTTVAVISLMQFVMTDFEFSIPEDFFENAPYEELPSEELIPESIPTPADDGCFAIVEGTLMFLPENWDGGPILNVPEYVGGEQVRTIGPGCFLDCKELTTILLPESVTAISPRAFAGCTRLRGLYLHDGVESIGQDAFAGCKALEAICIPASVTHIAEHTFDDCASLLYIFYGGMFEDWDVLYPGYINPFTTAVCLDGHYYHGSDK